MHAVKGGSSSLAGRAKFQPFRCPAIISGNLGGGGGEQKTALLYKCGWFKAKYLGTHKTVEMISSSKLTRERLYLLSYNTQRWMVLLKSNFDLAPPPLPTTKPRRKLEWVIRKKLSIDVHWTIVLGKNKTRREDRNWINIIEGFYVVLLPWMEFLFIISNLWNEYRPWLLKVTVLFDASFWRVIHFSKTFSQLIKKLGPFLRSNLIPDYDSSMAHGLPKTATTEATKGENTHTWDTTTQ